MFDIKKYDFLYQEQLFSELHIYIMYKIQVLWNQLYLLGQIFVDCLDFVVLFGYNFRGLVLVHWNSKYIEHFINGIGVPTQSMKIKLPQNLMIPQNL